MNDLYETAKRFTRGATLGLSDPISKYIAKGIGNIQYINNPEERAKFNKALDEAYTQIRADE